MMMRSLAALLASGFLTVSYADTAVVGGGHAGLYSENGQGSV